MTTRQEWLKTVIAHYESQGHQVVAIDSTAQTVTLKVPENIRTVAVRESSTRMRLTDEERDILTSGTARVPLIDVSKRVRERLGIGLGEAKRFVEACIDIECIQVRAFSYDRIEFTDAERDVLTRGDQLLPEKIVAQSLQRRFSIGDPVRAELLVNNLVARDGIVVQRRGV